MLLENMISNFNFSTVKFLTKNVDYTKVDHTI